MQFKSCHASDQILAVNVIDIFSLQSLTSQPPDTSLTSCFTALLLSHAVQPHGLPTGPWKYSQGSSCLRDFALVIPLSSNAFSLAILMVHIFILLIFSQISFYWDFPNYPSMFSNPSPEFSTAFSCLIFLHPLPPNMLYVLLIYFIICLVWGICTPGGRGFLFTPISWVSWTGFGTK